MKFLKIGIGVLLGITALVFIGQMVASESAEVVVMTSQGSEGPEETRLWVVEHEGLQYLRAQADSGWYQRLVATPEIGLERAGVSQRYLARTDPELAAEVNRLMRDKYGWRDVYIDWMIGGREEAVAVALVPAS